MTHKHDEEMILGCLHVINNDKSIGNLPDEMKDYTILCQDCIDKMSINDSTMTDLPKEVNYFCKICIFEKLKKNLSIKNIDRL